MTTWTRQGSGQNLHLPVVGRGDRVTIQGSSGLVKVDGDVYGHITLQGSSGTIKHYGKDNAARVVIQGSGGREYDMSSVPKSRAFTQVSDLTDECPDTPSKTEKGNAEILTVQKSYRPRDQWGS